MNKIIPFVKVLNLDDKIDEIVKIALDDTLKLDDPYTIKGDLIISGSYKIALEEEEFSYPIPVEIAIDEKYDTSKCKISVDDFYYELINEQDLRVKIDLILDELFYKEKEIVKEELVLEDNREEPKEEIKEEIKEEAKEVIEEILPEIIMPLPINETREEIGSTMLKSDEIMENLETNLEKDKTETKKPEIAEKLDDLFKETSDVKDYSVYRVYTVGEGETLEYIQDKYGVMKEDLASYNDLENMKPGSKLIIPSIDE